MATQQLDHAGFSAAFERHRRELQVHCYRMLGSFQDSEDMVQETFLRAWRGLAGYQGRAPFRAWLYRIATNACLDLIRRKGREAVVGPTDLHAEVPWLEPFPDALLPEGGDPAAEVVAKETIELAYITAIQHLPSRQRAVLLARDVLGWSAQETADLLDMTVAAVNSALQRARSTLTGLAADREAATTAWQPSPEERDLLARYIAASERADMAAMSELLKEDAVFSMPPEPDVFVGRETIIDSWTPFMTGPARIGDFKLIPTRANNQLAAANYVRAPGEADFEPLSLDVITVSDGLISRIITFPAHLFPAFGLPERL